MAYRDSITAYYRRDSSHLSSSVPDVLGRFADQGKTSSGDGEEYPGPHWYFDGFYWQQIGDLGMEKDRLGFVEGFLLCHSALSHHKGGTFSKTPAAYTASISGWYRIDPQSGAADTNRVNVKIADVLFKFRDRVR